MTDTHALTGLPATVRNLTLDLTPLAHNVCYAASVIEEAGPAADVAEAILESWEALTGLDRPDALDAAVAITRHPLPVTAAVCPF